jgi:alpha-mannosidase
MIAVLKLRCKLLVLFVIAGALLFAGSARAQRGNEMTRAAALLPPDLRNVVDRLGSLHELPAGVWKIHSGDLAHGEDANLDDSDWQPIAVGTKAPSEAVWFRQTVQVPETLNGYDLTGARIWFEIHLNGNGPMPEILYFNGRRVALGEDLEPVVLFDKAKPGDKIVVAVKALHTVDTKTFRGVTLRVDYADGRPNPEDLREQFLTAALLIPTLAPGDASRPQQLNAAIAAVDLAALDAHDQAKFDASLKNAQSKLELLKPLLDQATYTLDGNAHIDAAWLWPWTETVDVVKRTYGTALQLMYEYPDYKFSQSAAAYNEWVAQKYPDMNAEIAQRIKEGR